jgi:hypothetical protein
MALPAFEESGDLSLGVHPATLAEVLARFGTGSLQRRAVAIRLERIHRIAHATGHVRRFVLFGSFVTDAPDPNDVDVLLIMEDAFDVSKLKGDDRLLFDHLSAQAHFGASVFWVRRLAALKGEQATIEYWQVKRGGGQRGIVEIIAEAL